MSLRNALKAAQKKAANARKSHNLYCCTNFLHAPVATWSTTRMLACTVWLLDACLVYFEALLYGLVLVHNLLPFPSRSLAADYFRCNNFSFKFTVIASYTLWPGSHYLVSWTSEGTYSVVRREVVKELDGGECEVKVGGKFYRGRLIDQG